MRELLQQIKGYAVVFLAVSILVFLTGYFYTQIISSTSFAGSFLIGLLFLSASTDGFILLIHLFRKPVQHQELFFDPQSLTVIIACYNGEKVIGKTIEQALVHVPKEQIVVVSDASTDHTVNTALSYGVQVFENSKNLNKALSISNAVKYAKTKYVLILDDDTHIAKTFLPTSLLDEGYAAVAFNVMPEATGTFVNKLQLFEYRCSMIIGKSLRASVGAIGNVSGAIGIFRTADLINQAKKHSGQFGGEDQQRTMLVHLENNEPKGITFTDSTVYTEAPDTFGKLFKQRAKSWNCSTEETFFLCVQILFHPKTHFLLKLERIYLLFLLFTDPLRMLFWIFLFLHPWSLGILYLFYALIVFLSWLKTQEKDPVWLIFAYPLYSMFKAIARFVAHFWWFKLKYDYLVKNKYHRLITDRNLIFEYSTVTGIILLLWTVSCSEFYYYLVYRASGIEQFHFTVLRASYDFLWKMIIG